MKIVTLLWLIAVMLMAACSQNSDNKTATVSEEMENSKPETEEVKIENLLRDTLEITEGVEVIISYVELPKNTTLPYHYHPGEEFAYLLHGSGDLLLKDQGQKSIKAGQAGKVPLRVVHSFTSGNEGAKIVVFRVHEQGQPDRIMAEEEME